MSTQEAPTMWEADHVLHLIHQTASRPGPGGWVERRLTGLSLAVCNCGYNSLWVATDQLPSAEVLGEHGMPLTTNGQAPDLH
jgi:hypothetical protein